MVKFDAAVAAFGLARVVPWLTMVARAAYGVWLFGLANCLWQQRTMASRR
jgi:hypothetical protein